MVNSIQSKNLTLVEKQDSKPSSTWKTRDVVKYSAISLVALAGAGLAYSQLWETAQKIPEVVKTVYQTAKSIPRVVSTINDGVDASKGLYHGLGTGIGWIRSAANLVVEPTPVPATYEETTALGLEFVNNAWVAGSTVAANVAYLAPVLFLLGSATGRPGKGTAIAGLGLLTLQTAIPGFLGRVTNCASHAITSVGDTVRKIPERASSYVYSLLISLCKSTA